jgi:hypothetical protein
VLTYKEEPTEDLVKIGLSMGFDYMLKYQGLIVNGKKQAMMI